MIVADLQHAQEQLGGHTGQANRLTRAVDFLLSVRKDELADGRMEIDGASVFALVQSYTTVPASDPVSLEVHQKYIDIQYMAAGEEAIAWASTERMTVTKEYDAAMEAWFGALPAGEATHVRLAAGQLGIFFPTDGHAPRLAVGEPMAVKKIVVKVAVSD